MATAHDQDPVKEIEVLLISAQDLKNVKHFSKMRTYAVVYVEGDFHKEKTHIDEEGGTNPKWNEVLKVKFHEKLRVSDAAAALNVDIYAYGHVREKVVGSAMVLLSDILKDVHEKNTMEEEATATPGMMLRVWRPSGKPQGFLNLWVPPTGKVTSRTESLVYSMKDEEVEEVVEVVAPAAEESCGVWKENMEDKLGAPIVMLGSHAHSVLDLAVLGPSLDRSASV